MNVLVVTYWSYKDALIQTYTLPYVKIIRDNISPGKIYLVTIENPFHQMNDDDWNNEQKRLRNENIELIRFKYDHFGLKMIFRFFSIIFNLIRLIKNQNISVIHSWCLTAGALGYLLSIFTKKPLIIDSYEPHAEAMVENGAWKKSSLKFKLLFWLEKKQSKRAKTVIALTEGMLTYAKNKYKASFKNYYIKPALVNLAKFNYTHNQYLEQRKKHDITNEVVGLYAGKFGGIYLEEEVFDLIKVATEYWKGNFKFYILSNVDKTLVDSYLKKKQINKNCVETIFVNYNEIENYFHLADFAINPVKPVATKRYCTSIKDGEYWAAGLPVIITKNISDDSEIIANNNIGYVLNNLSGKEYLEACKKIDSLISKDKNELRNKIKSIAEKYRSFTIAENIYKEVYS